MVLTSMAAAPSFYVVICLIVLSNAVCANFTWELSNVVPECAETCVQSFLDVSYEGSRCGGSSSFRCLCSSRGNTGFTLGEGVVQCISAERRVGNCLRSAIGDDILQRAYFVCSDEIGAVEPTNAVITASLLLPTSSGGFVSFPPLPTSESTSRGRIDEPTELPTTIVTDTRPPPRPTTGFTRSLPTTFDTSTRVSSSETESTETATGSSLPPPGETSGDGEEENDNAEEGDDDDDDDDPPLSTVQITGISIGIAGAAVVAIIAIILARRCRRRKYPNAKTGFLPRRSTWGYNLTSESSNSGPKGNTRFSFGRPQRDQQLTPEASSIPPPPAYTRNSYNPDYNRTTWMPQTIGLALSPPPKRDVAPVSPMRRISKLLPAKPVMPPMFGRRGSPSTATGSASSHLEPEPNTESSQTLPIAAMFTNPRNSEVQPKQPSPKPLPPPPPSQPQPPPPQSSPAKPPAPPKLQIPEDKNLAAAVATASRARDSEMTEFEEDGVLSAVSQEGQIWRPPSTAPLSATTPYYVADKNGNWVLAGSSSSTTQVPSSRESVSEPKSAPVSGPAKPMVFPLPPSSNLGHSNTISNSRGSSKPSLGPPANITRNVSMATTSSSVYSQHSSVPKPLFYPNMGERRQSVPRRSTSQGQLDRTSSRGSDVTLFDSSSDESKEPTPPETRGSLSPVVESPRSVRVRSPAPQAQMPNQDQRNMNYQPAQSFSRPPKRPFAYFPPGQPSPTLGMMSQQQPPVPSGMSSYNVPHNGRRPMPHPGMARTGSPTMRIVEPSPEPDDRSGLPSTRNNPRHHPADGNYQPPEVRLSPRQDQNGFQPRPWPPQQQRQRQQGPNYQYPPIPPQPGQHPSDHAPGPVPFHMSSRPGPQRFPPHQQPPNRQPSFTPPSAHHGPQLLPRLDTEDQPIMPPTHQSGQFQSPISDTSASSSLLAKRRGCDRAALMSVSTDPNQHHSSLAKWRRDGQPATPRHPNELPSTPGWMPRLTPTRRGEDLFLNVQ